jgi:hypothetical protein
MHHIIIFFLPFKKPLAKEIVVKRSRSLAPSAKLLGFQDYSSTQKKLPPKRSQWQQCQPCPYEIID